MPGIRKYLAIWCAVLAAVLILYSAVTHWLAWRFAMGDWPVPSGTPWTYQLESGFIPALTVLTLLGAVAGLYHAHNCHEGGCPRIGKHKVDGTPWCTRHLDKARDYRTREITLETIAGLLTEIAELLRERG